MTRGHPEEEVGEPGGGPRVRRERVEAEVADQPALEGQAQRLPGPDPAQDLLGHVQGVGRPAPGAVPRAELDLVPPRAEGQEEPGPRGGPAVVEPDPPRGPGRGGAGDRAGTETGLGAGHARAYYQFQCPVSAGYTSDLSPMEVSVRWSRLLIPTLKEDPSDAAVVSHRLMLRAGMIRQLAAGIYELLPLGLRVIRKVEAIVREEMDRAGAQEVFLPAVQPAELWMTSGRWSVYGAELLRFQDRHGNDFCFGPTHEEVITSLVGREVRSYKELPLNLYQIQTKFRDERRPRFGLMRGREFTMKDAYSFDADEDGAKASYAAMVEAYERIFRRCGLDFRAVEADTGSIGGHDSHEFMVLADSGEDEVVACAGCGYGANVERAEVGGSADPVGAGEDPAPLETVATPGMKTVEEVAAFLEVGPERLVKTLIAVADEEPVVALVRGDHELNEVALRAHLGADAVALADDATVERVTGAPVGFAGPVGLPAGTRIVADPAIRGSANLVCGANQADAHRRGVQPGRDFEVTEWTPLRLARDGDPCPRCDASLELRRGIEVGHVFRLGTKYSEAMGAEFLDSGGKRQPFVMGCYGIGIGRTAAAAIEQNHDEKGIRWPVPIAPLRGGGPGAPTPRTRRSRARPARCTTSSVRWAST